MIWTSRAIEASNQFTADRLGLVAVLFAAVMGIVKAVQPWLVRMVARQEADLAAADAARIERSQLLQNEIADQKKTIEGLREQDRESAIEVARMTAEAIVAEKRIAQLEAERTELVDGFTNQRSALVTERDEALERSRTSEAEVQRLRMSTIELKADLERLKRGM